MPYAYAYAYAYAYGALGNPFYSLTTKHIPCFLHQLEPRLLFGLPKPKGLVPKIPNLLVGTSPFGKA